MTTGIQQLIDLVIANGGYRLQLANRAQGEMIRDLLNNNSNYDFDIEIYNNVSGSLLMWVNIIF